MSIFADNQPVIWEDTTDACSCGSLDYAQLAEFTDITQFQAKIYPCPGTLQELPVMSDGWVVNGSMSVGRSGACKTTGSSGRVSYYNVCAVGQYYFIEPNITAVFGTIEVYNGPKLITTITVTGNQGYAFLAVSPDISFYIDSSDDTCCIDSVSLRELSSSLGFGIVDNNGTVVDAININDSPTYFELSKDTVTVNVNWGDFVVTPGCYNLLFTAGCSGQFDIFNGGFTQWVSASLPKGWSESASTGAYTVERTANAGGMTFTSSGGAATLDFENDIQVYVPGTVYDFTLVLSNVKAGATVQVDLGGNTSAVFNADGTETFSLTCGAGTTVKLLFTAAAGNQTVGVDSIRSVVRNSTSVVWDYTSNLFKLASSWDCTHVVNISQDEDAFGMVFEGNMFAPRIRLFSTLVNSKYNSDRVTYHDNIGKKRNHYFETRKSQFLKVDHQPEYVHDFLAICIGSDHFFIDGNAYFVEDEEYSPGYSDNLDNMAPVVMEVSKETQLVKNIASGNAPNSIAYNQDTFYIVDPSDRSIIITEITTGDTLKSL